jgi:hypothetical protein
MTKVSDVAGALTDEEFSNALKSFPRGLSETGQKVAHAVLVEGLSLTNVCVRYDVKKQLAHHWVNRVYEKFLPEGWMSYNVKLPIDEMKKVYQLEQDAKKQWKESLNPVQVVRRGRMS